MTRSHKHPPRQRILAVHLLNDFSGSPLVFSQSLRSLQQESFEIHLFTATPSGAGFLSGLTGIQHHPLSYRWSRNRMITLTFFLSSQLSLFFRILFFARKQDIVYVNSILPFGAAIAARLCRCKIVYHIHEVSIRPALLKKTLMMVIRHTANHIIYVSAYVRQQMPAGIANSIVYNAVPDAFVERAERWETQPASPFTILLLCSLKKYKGIAPFVECAWSLPQFRFELVLNASRQDIDTFFRGARIPDNLYLYDAQSDTHPFYARASVVVNLSLPDQWIETFGMTILEAMYYKRPVIVPPIGGITELVEDGIGGFCLDSRHNGSLVAAICLLSADQELYRRMSQAAYTRARYFAPDQFRQSIVQIIQGLTQEYSSNYFIQNHQL